jgi:hypothetical protein
LAHQHPAVLGAAVTEAPPPDEPVVPPDDVLLEFGRERQVERYEHHHPARGPRLPFTVAWRLAGDGRRSSARTTTRTREHRARPARRSRAAASATRSSDDGPAEPEDIDGVRPAARPLCIALPSDERRAARMTRPSHAPRPAIDQRDAAELLCRCVLDGRDGALVEVRSFRSWVKDDPARQRWFNDPAEAVTYGLRRSGFVDVYLGCLPRFAHEGGKGALRDGARMVWIECDTAPAVRALRRFAIRPTFVICSGGSDAGEPNTHAWWHLRQPLELEAVEAINRRLVLALGGDPMSTDSARILRLPGTLRHKDRDGRPVVCTYIGDDVDVHALVAALPPLPPRVRRAPRAPRVESGLEVVSPADYVEHLTGREVGRNGKVQCPFHKGGQERTPSLHCYPDAAQGWTCFGCPAPPGREFLGGDIFTFAGLLWGLSTHADFPQLHERLLAEFGIPQPTTFSERWTAAVAVAR